MHSRSVVQEVVSFTNVQNRERGAMAAEDVNVSGSNPFRHLLAEAGDRRTSYSQHQATTNRDQITAKWYNRLSVNVLRYTRIFVSICLCLLHIRLYVHTHIYIYIYMYICILAKWSVFTVSDSALRFQIKRAKVVVPDVSQVVGPPE